MKIIQDLLTINEFSRPNKKIKEVRYIVLHWVANPKSTVVNNRDWFEKRKDGKAGYGSAHYIIDGDMVLQCIPDEELAYHVGSSNGYSDATKKEFGDESPNYYMIGIELCHPDWTGEFTKETLESAKKLCYLLMMEYGLSVEKITTHFNVVGWKNCPKYFVDKPEEFKKFKESIMEIPFLQKDDDILVGVKNGKYKILKDGKTFYKELDDV